MTSPPYRRDETPDTAAEWQEPTARGYAQTAGGGPGPAPAGADTGAAERKRPAGVTVLAVLIGIGAVLAFFGALFLLLGGAMVGVEGEPAAGGVMLAGLFLFVYFVLAAAVAWGLLRGARWSWYTALVLAGIGILNGLLAIATGDVLSAIFAFAINGLVIWYLLRPDVQDWFGVRHKAPWRYRSGRAA